MPSKPLSILPIPEPVQSALRKAGYTTADDLQGVSTESLTEELKISVQAAENVLQLVGLRGSSTNVEKTLFPTSQSASSMLKSLRVHRTEIPLLDQMVNGGLRRGQCLEIAGPPGSGKGSVALGFIRYALKEKMGVLIIDCQNSMSPSRLRACLDDGNEDMVHYVAANGFTELLAFVNQLSSHLQATPSISLILFVSLSAAFQLCPNQASRTRLLNLLKASMLKIASLHNVTYIVTTQLSTKLLNQDGSAGNFDTGAKAVMVPAIGNDWFPGDKSYKLSLSRTPTGQRLMYLKPSSLSAQNASRGPTTFTINPDGHVTIP